MIRYKKYQVTGENSPLNGLWYARPVIEETLDIGWELLSILPTTELKRIKTEMIEKYLPKKDSEN